MKRIKELHQQAMQWAEQAMLARIGGDAQMTHALLEKAFAAESEAASRCGVELEPTRSILHRSAASLALQIKRPRDAEQMIAGGLAGNPPDELANELRDLMEQVWSDMHNDEARKVKNAQPIVGAKRKRPTDANGRFVTATGYLKYASAMKKKKEIRVVADDENETRFIVPEGMMNDIVRPLWDNRVIAEGYRRGKNVLLEGIRECIDQ